MQYKIIIILLFVILAVLFLNSNFVESKIITASGGSYIVNESWNSISGYSVNSESLSFRNSNTLSSGYTYGIGDGITASMGVFGIPDANLSFGPPDATVFRWNGCGPLIQNESAQPEFQNNTHGIDLLCNTGNGTGDIQVRLSGSQNTGWIQYASNITGIKDLNLTTEWQTIYSGLGVNQCVYIWFNGTCNNVTQNTGVYEEYRIV